VKFVDFVRKGKIDGPLRRTFDRTQWSAELVRLGEDATDRNLHDAGLLIHGKLNEVRALIRFIYSTSLSKTTRLRALVALTNHFALTTIRRAQRQIEAVLARNSTAFAIEALAIKLPVLAGGSFSPDEIVQGIVDGAQIPISLCLQEAGSLEGVPRFSQIDSNALWGDLNLGVLYQRLEGLWKDCLWNGYVAIDGGPGQDLRFVADDREWVRRLSVSRLRYSNLAVNFFGMIQGLRASGDLPGLSEIAGTRKVQSLKKVGRKQVVVFVAEGAKNSANEEAAIMRLYATELFYQEFMSEAQDDLSGATVDQLLSAWILIQQLGTVVRAPLLAAAGDDDIRPVHAWLPECAPLLQRAALITAVAKGLSINPVRAAAIVDFLTYRGKPGQELWAQPLVPASDESLMPVFAALTAKAPRLLDVWLRQLGVKLERRGPAFEQFVRSELVELIERSALKPISQVLTQAVVFKPPQGREEEIDVVLCVGDAVVIGEAKCILAPAEAEQTARHRDTVIAAADQVARKAAAVSAHKAAFAALLTEKGMQVPPDFHILPLVIINSAIHAGFPVKGVPIADGHILRVFFHGQFTDTVSENNLTHDVAVYRVYQTVAEAPSVLAKYLQAPPQLARYVDALRERWLPVGRLKSEDREWTYLAYESVPGLMPFPSADPTHTASG
jgi:hypothetical protein